MNVAEGLWKAIQISIKGCESFKPGGKETYITCLFYFILFYFILFYFILFYFILWGCSLNFAVSDGKSPVFEDLGKVTCNFLG